MYVFAYIATFVEDYRPNKWWIIMFFSRYLGVRGRDCYKNFEGAGWSCLPGAKKLKDFKVVQRRQFLYKIWRWGKAASRGQIVNNFEVFQTIPTNKWLTQRLSRIHTFWQKGSFVCCDTKNMSKISAWKFWESSGVLSHKNMIIWQLFDRQYIRWPFCAVSDWRVINRQGIFILNFFLLLSHPNNF